MAVGRPEPELRSPGAESRRFLTEPIRRAAWVSFVEFFALGDMNAPVLVIGCGDGFWLEVLRSLGFTRVAGIDSSPEMVSAAVAKGLDVSLGEPQTLDAGQACDIVVLGDSLARLDDPRAALNAAHRVLRTRGLLYIVVPVYDSVADLYARRRSRLTRAEQCQLDDPSYLHVFDEQALHALLDECHFTIDDSRHFANAVPGVRGNVPWTGGGRYGRWLRILARSRFYVDLDHGVDERHEPALRESEQQFPAADETVVGEGDRHSAEPLPEPEPDMTEIQGDDQQDVDETEAETPTER
ncbi:class I SAM-dependent methyltransferase [Candidatus Poribacteria bacterium]|nr:class I SAM-dependent methyltransferase [Candidatus Poribacteria bacterium]